VVIELNPERQALVSTWISLGAAKYDAEKVAVPLYVGETVYDLRLII
jgi:hypothetical protein